MSPLSWRARIDLRAVERSLLAAAFPPACLLLLLSRWTESDWPMALALTTAYVILFASLHAGLALVRPDADPVFLPLVALLSGVSLAELARIDAGLAVRQLGSLAAGGLALLVVAGLPSRRAPGWVPAAVAAAGVAVLAWTALFGAAAGGARSWLVAGPVRVQPVEIVKVVLVWCWAQWLAPLPRTGRVMVAAAAAIGALVLQRELGYPLLMAAVAAGMVYVATGSLWVLGGAAVGVAAALAVAARGFPHLAVRVIAWLDPWSDPYGAGYQPLQAMFALAEGRFLGRGIGAGLPELIPAVHTDYLLGAIAEELGFGGAAAVLATLGLLVARAFAVARHSRDERGRVLAAGLGLGFGLQALWMTGALVRAVPLSGVGLPFVTYGGSAAFAHMAAVGLLLAVSAPAPAPADPVSGTAGAGDRAFAAGRVRRLAGWLAGAALAVIMLLGYWQMARADLRTHPYNPRLSGQAALAARGGIFDRRGEVLAETRTQGGVLQRRLVGPASLIHVVGYVDPRFGLSGIEASYHGELAGLSRSFLDWWRDPLRRRRQGKDVWLTIDARVQAAAERALAGRPGAIVALRPATGEVLAMVSNPGFAPAELPELLAGGQAAAGAPLVNRAVQGLYPPGSTFKVLTMAAAVDAGLITSREELADAQAALAASSNEFFARLGLQLGARELAAAAGRAGFGARLLRELPTAVSPLPGAVALGDVAQASIGQGELVATPLQMALVAAAMANGGVAMRPHVVLAVRAPGGPIARAAAPEPLGVPAFSPVAARAVTEAMVMAVESGTARAAALPGIRVAGKTGTAQNPHGEPHAWFIGFAPAFQPEVAVAVLVEGGGSGGQTAAPAGRAVLAAALQAMAETAEVNR